MITLWRVSVQCRKFNVKKVSRLVYVTARAYTPGKSSERRIRRHPLLFTTAVCAGSFCVSIISYQHARAWVQHSNTLKKLYRWWDGVAGHQKAFFGILVVNSLVFCLWYIPPMHRFMARYFQSSPGMKGSDVSMLLSCFSHREFWHIGINMFVLWSFMPPFEKILGKDLTVPFFLSAGVFSSLISHYSALMSRDFTPSRGASGAIMGVITTVVIHHPHVGLFFIFFPFVSIPAIWALGGVVTLDIIGLIQRWRMFDHAAHLGGVLFALLYDKVFSGWVVNLKKATKKLLPPSR